MSDPTVSEDFAQRLRQALQQKGFRSATASGIVRREGRGPYPALPPARRFWLEDLMDRRPGLNVLSCRIRIPGNVPPERLGTALEALRACHETLRTVFRWEGDTLVADPGAEGSVSLVILEPDQAEAAATEGLAALRMDAPRPPWRVLADSRGGLVRSILLQAHHALLDWAGLSHLAADLLADLSHDPRPERGPEPGDAAIWWGGRGGDGEREASYWRQRLAGLPHPPSLVAAAPGAGAVDSVRACQVPIPADLRQRAIDLARAWQTTPFTVLLAIYALALQRFAGSDHIVIGAAMANRDIPGAERIIGCLSDLVPLRLDLSDGPGLRPLVDRHRDAIAEDLGHARLGYERLKSAVAAEVTAPERPLFNHLFGMIASTAERTGGALAPLPALVPRAEVALDILDDGEAWTALFEFDGSRIPPAVADAMVEAFLALGTEAVIAPDRGSTLLPLARQDGAEQAQDRWQRPATEATPPDLGSWLRSALVAQGDLPLLWSAGHWTTARDVLARAGDVAAHLRAAGVAPGAVVAICLPRSPDLVAAIVGSVQAGASFVLLDPAHPVARTGHILRTCGAALLLAEAGDPLDPPAGMKRLSPDGISPAAAPVPWERRPPGTPAYLVYTSGSTGTPKGVRGSEEGLVRRLQWGLSAFPAAAGDRTCLKTSPAFVDFLTELIQPLLAGSQIIIADAETARSPHRLAQLLTAERVTRLTLVPTLLQALIELREADPGAFPALRLCVSSGEPLPPTLAHRFGAAVPGAQLVNLYGSCEVSGDVTAQLGAAEAQRPSIGWPLSGAEVRIVDDGGRAVPQGAIGEIVVSGDYVALGYASDDPEGRFAIGKTRGFRTGDLACWLQDAGLILLGRRDRQVKIDGVRIDCAEVERAILEHPSIREAHVLPVALGGGALRLWAYVAGPAVPDATTLRLFLARHLPRATLPAGVTPLAALPTGPTGKLDRNALPAPDLAAADAETDAAPLPADRLWIAEVWQSVLGGNVPGPAADFFRLGGASLDAIRVCHRIGARLGRAVPVSALFETPILAAFAERVDRDRDLWPVDGPVSGAAAPPAGEDGPATPNQTWLWHQFRADHGSPAFNLPVAYRLNGTLDHARLDRALVALVAHHPALRTKLRERDGQVRQVIAEPPEQLLVIEDLSGAPDAGIDTRLTGLGGQAFDLERDLPIRAHLLVQAPDRAVLSLVLHHVATDGWSGQLLVRDLGRLLRGSDLGQVPEVPPLVALARWQAGQTPALQALLPKYLQGLEGARPPTPPGMCNRDRTRWVSVVPVEVPHETTAKLVRMGHATGTTLYQAAVTLWCVVMQRLCDLDRPIVGIVQSGRDRPTVAETVGFLATTTLIAPHLSAGQTPAAALGATRSAIQAALEFQDIPLSWVQPTGHWPSGLAGAGLACLVLEQSLSAWTLDIPGCSAAPVLPEASPAARADLALILTRDGDHTRWSLEYATSRVPDALAQRLAASLAAMAGAMAEGTVQRLGSLPAAPAEAPPSLLSAAPVTVDAERLDEVLSRRARDMPQGVCLIGEDRSWTFSDLERRTEALARQLGHDGVRAGCRIGVALPPGPEQIALLFALWRLGAVAVLLDPAWPEARRTRALALSSARLVLTEVPAAGISAGPMPPGLLALAGTNPSPAAAIIFTSGTTGEPKGIEIAHQALCRLGSSLTQLYGLSPQDRVLQTVSPAFDVALSDLAMALSAGASLLALPRPAVTPGRSLTDTLRRHEATVMQVTAAVLHATEPVSLPKLRLIAVGGEALRPSARMAWAAGRRLLTIYGPTEATVSVCAADLDEASPPGLIGWPVAEARLAVVDPALNPVPQGFPGQLLIGGPNLSTGYVGNAGETAARFGPAGPGLDAAGWGTRWYRTGDRAVLLPAEGLVFLGRIDRQLKVRGHRFEPAGIEALLEQVPGVLEAHVDLLAPDAQAAPLLCAWVRTAPGAPGSLSDDARAALRRQLPEALVPSHILPVASFPLTPNGKLDRAALPSPLQAAVAPADIPQQPADVEAVVRALWQDLLQTGADLDGLSFFDAGGHSLLIVALQQRLERRFGIQLPIAEFFAAPTIPAMAAMLRRHLPQDAPSEADEYEEFLL